MTKKELLDELALSNDHVSKAADSRTLEFMINIIKKEVTAGNSVDISGLGKFTSATQAAREGINALTGEPFKSEAKQVPKFKAAADFKRQVAGK